MISDGICSFFPELLGNVHSMTETVIAGIVFLAIVILVSVCIGKVVSKKWKGNKAKTIIGFVLISTAVAITLICFFGVSVKAIKGIIFTLILLVASYSDIKTRECDDSLSLMILITAFIGIELTSILSMFIAAMFTAGMFLLIVVTVSDGIGGADIKIASASSFLLGFHKGIMGLIAGLLLAIIVNSIKSKKSGFPMLPYLTAAFIPAFFI